MIKIQIILHYADGVAPHRLTSNGAHLRGSAPGNIALNKHRRVGKPLGTLFPIRSGRELNPRSTAPITMSPTIKSTVAGPKRNFSETLMHSIYVFSYKV